MFVRQSGGCEHLRVDRSVVTITVYRACTQICVLVWSSKAAHRSPNTEDTPPEHLQQKTVWGMFIVTVFELGPNNHNLKYTNSLSEKAQQLLKQCVSLQNLFPTHPRHSTEWVGSRCPNPPKPTPPYRGIGGLPLIEGGMPVALAHICVFLGGCSRMRQNLELPFLKVCKVEV
jgi:hypothetical protein